MPRKPLEITSYTHPTTADLGTADPQPGYYYVSVRDGTKHAALLGPFPQHQQALDWVTACKEYANNLDPWSHFYGFGTRRLPLETAIDKLPTGKLNAVFPNAPGLITHHKEEEQT